MGWRNRDRSPGNVTLKSDAARIHKEALEFSVFKATHANFEINPALWV